MGACCSGPLLDNPSLELGPTCPLTAAEQVRTKLIAALSQQRMEITKYKGTAAYATGYFEPWEVVDVTRTPTPTVPKDASGRKCAPLREGEMWLVCPGAAGGIRVVWRGMPDPSGDPEALETCPICLEAKANVTLRPCGHWLCDACLSKCLDNGVLSGKLDTGRKVMTCPVCRQAVHDPHTTWTVRHAKKDTIMGAVGFHMCDRTGLTFSDTVANAAATMTAYHGYYRQREQERMHRGV